MKKSNSTIKKKIVSEELGVEKIAEMNYQDQITFDEEPEQNYPFTEDKNHSNTSDTIKKDSENY